MTKSVKFFDTIDQDLADIFSVSPSSYPGGAWVGFLGIVPSVLELTEAAALASLDQLLEDLEIPTFEGPAYLPSYEYVRAMNLAFGLPVRDTVQLLSQKEHDLSIKLIKEELQELEDAYASGNLREVVDALGDLDVVLNGYMVRTGVHGPELAKRVFESNMSKVCKTEEDAVRGCQSYSIKGIQTYYKESGDGQGWIIYRSEDGKFLKGPDFKVPNIDDMLPLEIDETVCA